MDGRLLQRYRTRINDVEGYWTHLTWAAQVLQADDASSSTKPLAPMTGSNEELPAGLRKTFDYSSIMVALYGAVEDYVEALIEHCVEVIGESFQTYRELPPKLREQHEKLSIRLAERVAHSSYSGHLDLRMVVGRLHSCLNDKGSFSLNTEAFALHSANMRTNIVREMFSSICITNIDQKIAAHSSTRDLMAKYGRSEREAHFYINDLADRRNVIAHGERPYDIISTAMMDEYLFAVRAFGEALFDSALLGVFELAIPKTATALGKPTAIYKSGKVICFQPLTSGTLSRGDRLLWQSANGWRLAQVKTLQVDRNPQDRIDYSPDAKIGVGISIHGSTDVVYWTISEHSDRHENA